MSARHAFELIDADSTSLAVTDLQSKIAHLTWRRERDLARIDALERFCNEAIARERGHWRHVWSWIACGSIFAAAVQGYMYWRVFHG